MFFLTKTLNNLYDAKNIYIKTEENEHIESRQKLSYLEDALRYENGTLSTGLICRQKFVFDTIIWREKESIKKESRTRFFCDLGSVFAKSSAIYPTEINSKCSLNALSKLEQILEDKEKKGAFQNHEDCLNVVKQEISRLKKNVSSISRRNTIKNLAALEVQKENFTGVALVTIGVASIFFSLGHLSYYLKK